jgi:hypothetical protein
MIYVQKKGSDTWHFAANCTQLPKVIAKRVELEMGRPRGDSCNQCLSKERRGVLVPIEVEEG